MASCVLDLLWPEKSEKCGREILENIDIFCAKSCVTQVKKHWSQNGLLGTLVDWKHQWSKEVSMEDLFFSKNVLRSFKEWHLHAFCATKSPNILEDFSRLYYAQEFSCTPFCFFLAQIPSCKDACNEQKMVPNATILIHEGSHILTHLFLLDAWLT